MKRDKRARLQDFNDRLMHGENAARVLTTRYITINPFGNGNERESAIGSGIKVDAYWDVTTDVLFVQMYSRNYLPSRSVGTYVRRNANTGYLNIVEIMDQPTITKAVFEKRLTLLLTSGAVDRLLSARRQLTGKLIPA